MSERRKARASLSSSTAEQRAELIHEMELFTVAAVWTFRLGNPGAEETYGRAVELAARLGFPAPPPLELMAVRYFDERRTPLDAWRDQCGI